jgi:hypothetical protein
MIGDELEPGALDPTLADESPLASAGVGYGRPPVATRFQPGRSGNPRGRPKGARNLSAVIASTLKEKVPVTENGRRRHITKLEAAVKQLVNRAASGEARATQLLFALIAADEAKPPEIKNDRFADADLTVMTELARRLGRTS